jgi:hypothetical protein
MKRRSELGLGDVPAVMFHPDLDVARGVLLQEVSESAHHGWPYCLLASIAYSNVHTYWVLFCRPVSANPAKSRR